MILRRPVMLHEQHSLREGRTHLSSGRTLGVTLTNLRVSPAGDVLAPSTTRAFSEQGGDHPCHLRAHDGRLGGDFPAAPGPRTDPDLCAGNAERDLLCALGVPLLLPGVR